MTWIAAEMEGATDTQRAVVGKYELGVQTSQGGVRVGVAAMEADYYCLISGDFYVFSPPPRPLLSYPTPLSFRAVNDYLSALNSAAGGPVDAFGSALFPLHSTINHSCAPNASTDAPTSDPSLPQTAGISVVATEWIAPGDEIRISYVDTLLPPTTRGQTLQSVFGFSCACRTCVAKAIKRS